MDKMVLAQLNIEHLRKLLAAETDESKRKTMQRTVEKSEAKLAALLN